jgi:hypothetical protein
MVWEWTRERGPVSGWSAAFLADVRDAQYNDGLHRKVEREWASHVRIGKVLARDLRDIMRSRLPADECALRDVLRETVDLLYTLLNGIAIAEAHLALVE